MENNHQTLIIEIAIARRDSFRLQSLLEGEDGLAIVRCFDPNGAAEHIHQQLWSTPAQRQSLHDWLNNLPHDLPVQIVREWIDEREQM